MNNWRKGSSCCSCVQILKILSKQGSLASETDFIFLAFYTVVCGLLMQFSLNLMEKSRFFPEGEPSKLSESSRVVDVIFLDKTYLNFTLKMRADFLLIIHQASNAPSRLVRPLG